MTKFFSKVCVLAVLALASFSNPSKSDAATVKDMFDVNCTGSGCLTSGWETYGYPVKFPGACGLIEVGKCRAVDCAGQGADVFSLSGFDRVLNCFGAGCFTSGWTGTSSTTTALIETATCVGAGCFTNCVSFSRPTPGTYSPWNINWLGVPFDVALATLTCRGSDCGANGWDIFSGGSLIAEADCMGAGCFMTGYKITTYVSEIPLPAGLPMLGGALLVFAAFRRAKRSDEA